LYDPRWSAYAVSPPDAGESKRKRSVRPGGCSSYVTYERAAKRQQSLRALRAQRAAYVGVPYSRGQPSVDLVVKDCFGVPTRATSFQQSGSEVDSEFAPGSLSIGSVHALYEMELRMSFRRAGARVDVWPAKEPAPVLDHPVLVLIRKVLIAESLFRRKSP
jgi:hypothetical protein